MTWGETILITLEKKKKGKELQNEVCHTCGLAMSLNQMEHRIS